MGYKVDQVALALSKQQNFGRDYWRNSGVMMDLIIDVFQKPLPTNKFAVEQNFWGGALQAITTGDFNNDGWIDVFNAGGAYNGTGSSFAFLMWDPIKKASTILLYSMINLLEHLEEIEIPVCPCI